MTKKSDAPAIRFKGFSDAWEQRKAKELFVSTADKGYPELPVLSATQDRGMIRRDENSINIFHDKKNEAGYKRVLPGQFVIHLRSFQGGFAHSAIEGITSPAYTVFGFSEPEKHDSEYWKYVFTSKSFIQRLETVTYGIRDGRSISYEEFLTLGFVYPSKAEQTAIARYLDKLSDLITLHQRKCVFLFGFFQAFISMIFTASTFSWEQRKVGDLLIERNQQAPMSDEYPLMAFIANEGVAPKGERYDRSALVTDTVNKLYKKTEKGDFIYSSNNLETGSIGLNKYGKACISPVYSIFEPTGIADSNFLGRRLVRKDFINAMVKWRQGVIYGQWRIHESDFLKIEITVPSVEEQRKIGTYLDQLDHLITLHQRECISFTARAGRLILTANKKRNTSSWEQRKVSDLAEKTYGGGTPTTSNEAYWNGDIPWIQSSDVVDGKLLGVEPRKWITQDGLNNSAAQLIPGNSIAIITRVGVGKLAFMPYSYATSQDFLSLSKLNAEPLFTVYACYKKLQSELNAVQGTSIKGITKDELLAKNIMVPRYAEQQQIGAFFKQLDHLITLHQRKPFLMKWRTSDANRNQTNRLVL